MSMTAAVERIQPDIQWRLTDYAKYQMEECAIAFSELYRLLHKPDIRMPNGDGTYRYNGYGLSAITDGQTIVSVQIDGASSSNWEGWARERAEFGDSDIEGADALVAKQAQLLQGQRGHRGLLAEVPEQGRGVSQGRSGGRGHRKRQRPEHRSGPVRVRKVPVEQVQRVEGPAQRLLAASPVRQLPGDEVVVPQSVLRAREARVADEAVAGSVRPRIGDLPPVYRPEPASVDVLNLVHPALRDEVERQVMSVAGGDFSKLVITSPTNVTIALH